MANKNWPHGFQPLMVDLAGAPVGARQYAKPASDTNAIFAYDVVRKVASSTQIEGLVPTPNVQTYATGTPGTTLMVGSALNYGAASKNTIHLVIDDPSALFSVQVDGTLAVTVASHVGKNANVKNTAQTAANVFISAMQVDNTTIATTAGDDLRINDIFRGVTNAEGANAVVEVFFLKHAYAQGSAGV